MFSTIIYYINCVLRRIFNLVQYAFCVVDNNKKKIDYLILKNKVPITNLIKYYSFLISTKFVFIQIHFYLKEISLYVYSLKKSEFN